MMPAKVTAKIVAEVAQSHGSTPAELCGRRFKKRLFDARRELIQRLRAERPHLSTRQIGQMLDKRHHSTIVHYLHDVEAHRARGRARWRALRRNEETMFGASQ